jgi:carbonic anhydrase
MQIVHKYKESFKLGAVLGIFFDRKAGGNTPNPFIESVKFSSTVSGKTIDIQNANLADLIASVDFSQYWSYPGSLTVPPCTEGLKWTVIKKPLPISDAQLAGFTKFFASDKTFANGNGNNRVIQPLNQRMLYFTAAAATSITTSALAFAMAAYYLF